MYSKYKTDYCAVLLYAIKRKWNNLLFRWEIDNLVNLYYSHNGNKLKTGFSCTSNISLHIDVSLKGNTSKFHLITESFSKSIFRNEEA